MNKPLLHRKLTSAVLATLLTVASSYAGLPHVPQSSHAISDNGKYRLDCVAQSEEEPVFKMTDIKDGKVLWSQKKKWDEEAQAIYVHDNGSSVVENIRNTLVFTTPEGKVTGRVNIPKKGLTPEEYDKYAVYSSAGPMWGQEYAVSYFVHNGESLLFVVRNWWENRIIVDFDKGKIISPTKEILESCVAKEREIALRKLARAQDDPEVRKGNFTPPLFRDGPEVPDNDFLPPLLGIILMAGQLSFEEAAPLIEKLQGYGDEFEDSAKIIDLSLRRLGSKPQRGVSRSEKWGRLKIGMEHDDVIENMGVPDFGNDTQWEYDVDAAQPFSLLVRWDEEGTKVVAIEKTEKPLWTIKGERDRNIVDSQFFGRTDL